MTKYFDEIIFKKVKMVSKYCFVSAQMRVKM
jgi:hypothetical protein